MFHQNEDSRYLTIEDLKTVKFEMDGKYVVCENIYRERAKSKYLTILNEKSRVKMKPIVARVVIMIQLYKLREKVIRAKRSKIELNKIIKFYNDEDDEDHSSEEGMVTDEDYFDGNVSKPDHVSQASSKRKGSRLSQKSKNSISKVDSMTEVKQ